MFKYIVEEQPLLGAIIWCTFVVLVALLCDWLVKSGAYAEQSNICYTDGQRHNATLVMPTNSKGEN